VLSSILVMYFIFTYLLFTYNCPSGSTHFWPQSGLAKFITSGVTVFRITQWSSHCGIYFCWLCSNPVMLLHVCFCICYKIDFVQFNTIVHVLRLCRDVICLFKGYIGIGWLFKVVSLWLLDLSQYWLIWQFVTSSFISYAQIQFLFQVILLCFRDTSFAIWLRRQGWQMDDWIWTNQSGTKRHFSVDWNILPGLLTTGQQL